MGVELAGGGADEPFELLLLAARVAQRAIDRDVIHGRADLARELSVDRLRLGQRFLLIGHHQPAAATLVIDRRGQPPPTPPVTGMRPRAATNPNVDGDRCRQRTREQVKQPPQAGLQRRRPQVQDLLERSVAVHQTAAIGGVDCGRRGAVAERTDDPVALRRGLRSGRRLRDRGHGGELA